MAAEVFMAGDWVHFVGHAVRQNIQSSAKNAHRYDIFCFGFEIALQHKAANAKRRRGGGMNPSGEAVREAFPVAGLV